MDKLKGLADKAMHSGSSSGSGSSSTANANANTAGGNTSSTGTQDYGDKGLAFAEKKAGYSQSAATNEKITDGARDFYEKQTGSKVDSKYSN